MLIGQAFGKDPQHRGRPSVHNGCSKSANEPDEEVRVLERLQVVEVLDKCEARTEREPMDCRINHEADSFRPNEKDHGNRFEELLDDGSTVLGIGESRWQKRAKLPAIEKGTNHGREGAGDDDS